MTERDIALAIEGDEAAYRRLIEATASTVCSIALAIVRNVEASEDIAQEVFLVVWTQLRKLRNPASFLPWLRQVTRNQAQLWLRANRREVFDDDTLAAAVDARPSPAESLLADEERRVLAEVLEQLPEEAREVVILYYREGSSAKHVAELLGISEAAVKQRLSRARVRIREELMARFGSTLARTAPGTAFVATVAGALTGAAPTAAAATLAASGAKLGFLAIAKTALIGALGGAAGVLVGMKHLDPPHDEEESRELHHFRNAALTVVVLASIAIAASLRFAPLWRVIAVASFLAALGWLYGYRLPRILDRRWQWERSVNPAVAEQHRKEWMHATIAQTVGAVLGGASLMFALLRWAGD